MKPVAQDISQSGCNGAVVKNSEQYHLLAGDNVPATQVREFLPDSVSEEILAGLSSLAS